MWISPAHAASFFAVNVFPFMVGLLILPPVMIFFFTGYLRPTRGKAKMTMLGPSVFLALIYVILAYTVSLSTDMLGNLLVFSAWGIGCAILTAGGLSIVQSYDESTSPGMLDVSSLHYGPPKIEETPEVEAEADSAAEVVEESKNTSDESKPDEPVSE